MGRTKVFKINLIAVFFVCFALICGCASNMKSTKWTCFYQEEGKNSECRNDYDQSFTQVLKDSNASIQFVRKNLKGIYRWRSSAGR